MYEMLFFTEEVSEAVVRLEEQLIKVNNQLSGKNKLKLVPVINMNTLKDLDFQDAQDKYQLALDYQAMHLFGAKRAQKFLIKSQKLMLLGYKYSELNVAELVEAAGGEWEEFLLEQTDPLIGQQVLRNQRLAGQFVRKINGNWPLLIVDNEQMVELQTLLESNDVLDLGVTLQSEII
ncbi:hypothetical protein ESZ50_11160 [Weissella muntiaci]|uniref:Uncharacterized protein n=1 Tax=Weissella muntiaci TaxID=2508881 RepID=A0A6C2C271_9LACO|nr:DsbA family protein [Weissella muntiaci]TYC47779.1 hypothetical protein ESZ50_11160 [Weissella muntiaci]